MDTCVEGYKKTPVIVYNTDGFYVTTKDKKECSIMSFKRGIAQQRGRGARYRPV